MPHTRRTFLTALGSSLTGIAGSGLAGERHKVRWYHARPQQLCELPPYAYAQGASSLPALALSQTALLIRSPVPPEAGPLAIPQQSALERFGQTVVYYQLKQVVLQNGHCSISRVALAIGTTGYWVLSLRADQNPLQPPPLRPLVAASPAPDRLILPGSTAPSRFTAHIKRNLFMVPVRGYGAFSADADPDASPGRPVLFELWPASFWVERGVPLFPRFEGNDPHIGEFFANIDRVEIELTYR